MATATKKCCGCKERFPTETMIKLPLGFFHSIDCSYNYCKRVREKAQAKQASKAKRDKADSDKAVRVKHKADKERIKKRSEWYGDLKTEIHYLVKHVIRKGELCYTCDKPQRFTDSGQAFHAGHYMPAKQVDPRRFMLENLRMQCYKCNCQLSGNQAVYRKRLIEEKGEKFVLWLECEVNHKELKEVFPHYEDIKIEIARYRKLIRESKLKPIA